MRGQWHRDRLVNLYQWARRAIDHSERTVDTDRRYSAVYYELDRKKWLHTHRFLGADVGELVEYGANTHQMLIAINLTDHIAKVIHKDGLLPSQACPACGAVDCGH